MFFVECQITPTERKVNFQRLLSINDLSCCFHLLFILGLSAPPLILSTATRNQVPGIKVDRTYVFPQFGHIGSSTVFKSAWETVGTADCKPCIIKFSSVLEILKVQTIRNYLTGIDFEAHHLVDAKLWWPKLHRGTNIGVCMPRYLGVLTEFTGKHFTPDTTLVLKLVDHVSLALKTLHSHRLVHMDVKPSNVFLNHKCDAFLGDFGSCTVVGDQIESFTPGYTIKEVPKSVAYPLLDWVALLLTALQLLNKLPFTEQPHPFETVSHCIDRLRGDVDACHIEVVKIYDEFIATNV